MAVKIGILSFAHMHALSYAECVNDIPDAVLAGVADDDSSRGKEMARQFDTRFFPTYAELLREPLDSVIVGSENSRHKELTLMAADAGKHVLCEKPIATNVADAREMISACEKKGVKLMTAFPCRYSPAMVRMKGQIESGQIGEILAINGTNRGQNPHGWFTDLEKAGGGAVMDHTVHVVDLARWLTKSEPVEVYAEISNLVFHDDYDDVGILTITFDNGVFATLDTSWSRPKSFPTWGDVTMKVTGTNGMAFLDMFAQNTTLYSDSKMSVSEVHWGSSIDHGLIQDFVQCVAEDQTPVISGLDGLRALEVALAAYESARTGQPVRLPLE